MNPNSLTLLVKASIIAGFTLISPILSAAEKPFLN